MALSPYTKPTTPWDPNGISQYVLIANRPTVKGLWDTWVDSYHVVTRNNNNAVGPVLSVRVVDPGKGYTASSVHSLTYNQVPIATLGSYEDNIGSGASATLNVLTVSSSGGILTVSVAAGGTGYRIGDILNIGGPDKGILVVTGVTFAPQAYPVAFDYAGLYTDGAP